MSLSRNNKIWSVAESLLERLGNKKRSANRREQKPKKLFVDQLEERQLLSLTVASTENLLVNPSWQDIRGDIAVDYAPGEYTEFTVTIPIPEKADQHK